MATSAGAAPEYRSYQCAKSRCNNPRQHDYPRYGGRGIKFLYTSIHQFLADVGPRPPGTTLERIDNDGNYQPGNCTWATPIEQNNNRRDNRRLTCFGRTLTITQWARERGIPKTTLHDRLRRGVPLQQALRRRVPVQLSLFANLDAGKTANNHA